MMRSAFAVAFFVFVWRLDSSESSASDAYTLRNTNRSLGKKGRLPFARPWAGLPPGNLSNFVDRGISRCARKKPTHQKFVDCVENFCTRNIGGRRVEGLTAGHCDSILKSATASDIRKPADVIIQEKIKKKLPKALRDDINACGVHAELKQSPREFMTCLIRVLRDRKVKPSLAAKIKESGKKSSIGIFGEPKEGSNRPPTGRPTSRPSSNPTVDDSTDDELYNDDTSISSPSQSVPSASAPVQIAPPTSAPVQVAPPTSAPVQVAPPTSAPVQAAPPTSAPVQNQSVPAAPTGDSDDGTDDNNGGTDDGDDAS